MSVLMIKVADSSGKEWNINLDYVEVVEFQSLVAGLANNLHVENVVMQGGEVITLPIGTWHTAITQLLAEFNVGKRVAANEIYIVGAP